MKRVLTIATALTMLAIPVSAEQYGWTISSSSTDPFVNSGPVLSAPLTLYLWFACNVDDGMAVGEFDVSAPGMSNFGFNPLNGYLNAGGASNLLLAVAGCPNAPVVAGQWTFFGFAPADICLVPAAGTGMFNTINCDDVAPQPFPITQKGYAYGTAGGACDEELCPVVSVDAQSWGSVKSLYR